MGGKSDIFRLGPKTGALGAFWHPFPVDHLEQITSLFQGVYGISVHGCAVPGGQLSY